MGHDEEASTLIAGLDKSSCQGFERESRERQVAAICQASSDPQVWAISGSSFRASRAAARRLKLSDEQKLANGLRHLDL